MAKRRTNQTSASLPLLAAAGARIAGELPPLPTRRKGVSRSERFARMVDASGGPCACHIWRGSVSQQSGYPQFYDVSPATGRPSMRAGGTVAWEIANGQAKPHGLSVLHSDACTSKLCVNPTHLRLGSPADNSRDAKRTQRLKGPRLDADKALKIVELRRLGVPNYLIAERFAVSCQSVHSVLVGRTWAHVTKIQAGPRKGGRPRKRKDSVAPPAELTKAQRRERVREALPP